MLFMVVEHFDQGKVPQIYRRFRENGRMAPEGLRYVDSWVEASFARCFQLMECDDVAVLQEWVLQWSDLARFEIIPVVPSKVAAEAVTKLSKT
jgi:Protein of unknown function (DUF3303)